MSFLGDLFSSNTPDERFIDDQAAQEDYRGNKYVGHIIDQACTVYDTMFNALEYAIKGRASAIKQIDKVLAKLEAQCNKIVEKYKEILSRLKDTGAGIDVSFSIDIAKDALDILNSNPVLRRYVGEANYWMLWDMLAVMSGQGMSVGADVSTGIKDAIKGTIYALLSMTNGMMHFESYIAQITQFWGWLYMKEIWLPLTDSVCPQVTCQYYYKKPERDNPIPGPANYAPMPFPIFNQTAYSWPYIVSHFSYDDPSTWDVLTQESRTRMQRAYNYWKSNYTNAVSANDLLSGASRILTNGTFTVGFGPRNNDYGGKAGNTPLKIGATFNQLDTSKGESFPVKLMDDAMADAFAEVDKTFLELISAMGSYDATFERDSRLRSGGYDDYVGKWDWAIGRDWDDIDEIRAAAIEICGEVASALPQFSAYKDAIVSLSELYRNSNPAAYEPVPNGYSALSRHLHDFYADIAEAAALPALKAYVTKSSGDGYVFNPYQAYTDSPDAMILYNLAAQYMEYSEDASPFYTGVGNIMAVTVDSDGELGRKIDGGREPLFAALGVYGDLKGLYPWSYEVVPYDSFRDNYVRIKAAYHIYYKKGDPTHLVFADRTFQAGTIKYIATCRHVATDIISRGTGQNAERFTAYIFPGETCSVYEVPESGVMFGQGFPSFATLQRVDAVSDSGQQYMYDLTRNQIPRYPKYVDADRWSIMDLIHELWLLADALTPICGDGGERKQKLNDLLNELSLNVRNNPSGGPMFIGQLPASAGQGDTAGEGTHVELEFSLMAEFANKIKKAIDTVYDARDAVLEATRAW